MARYKRNSRGSIIFDGFTVTNKEEEEYKKRVRSANNRRNYLLNKYYNEAKDTPNMVGISKKSYAQLLEEKGFINERMSASLNGLTSKQEFKQELKDLKTVASKTYTEQKIKNLRKTMIRQLQQNTGNAGRDIRRLIRNMTDSELASLYIHSPDDLIAQIFGSGEDGEEEENERAEKTRANIFLATKNVTTKENRQKRTDELIKPKTKQKKKEKRKKIIKGKHKYTAKAPKTTPAVKPVKNKMLSK